MDIRVGFVADVELPPGKFDIVCAWHVLEHIREPQEELRRLRSVTQEDGRLFVEVPNIESVWGRRHGARWLHLDPAHHVGFYNAGHLEALLAQTGFRLETAFTIPFLTYLHPSKRFTPRELAAQARDSLVTRTLPLRPHPSKHELLRAVARAV